MKQPFGIFAWYDVFTVQGYRNWMQDSLMLTFFPGWELYEAFVRQGRRDWTYGTVEKLDPVDKNRLFK